MNGMAKHGYLDLSITDYGIGINENGVGNGLGFEIGPIAIIETELCKNDSRILIIKNSSTTWVVVFIAKTQPKVLVHMVLSSNKWTFFKFNHPSVVVDVFKFQRMKLIMCHNLH